MSSSRALCDIVMPVHNGLTYVAEAIASIAESTTLINYRLILVNDASDTGTTKFLEKTTSELDNASLLSNVSNLGFLQSCLRGFAASEAPYLLLLNSDVVVTADWLPRLLDCAESDERIAAVNPLTNHAAHLELSMLPGASFLTMDRLLRARQPDYPDVVTGEGFCLLLRRAALDNVGFLDPIFGHGYCEESDLCMRLTTAGYRTVISDNVYVFHRGSGSFGSERLPKYLENRKIFDQRWLKEYRRQFRTFRRQDPVGTIRRCLAGRQRWVPVPAIWAGARAVRRAVYSGRPISAAKLGAKHLMEIAVSRRPVPSGAAVEGIAQTGALSVNIIIERLIVSGGVLTVLQLANRLIRLGVEIRLLTLFEDPLVRHWQTLYAEPLLYKSSRELTTEAPAADIVIATLWKTAPWARTLIDNGRAKHGVYLLQDYEAYFFPQSEGAMRARIESTLGLVENRIVTSNWLQQLLRTKGHASVRIPIGMDLYTFYPRNLPKSSPAVCAMARPGTPYRGFDTLTQTLTIIKQERPDVAVHLFGDAQLRCFRIPFDFVDHGIVSDQNQLAKLYSQSDVFLDLSDFQGFGRCALEAMRCGTACVLTNVGGVNDYARDGENAILVEPRAPDQAAAASLALLADADRRAQLIGRGIATASGYSDRKVAETALAYLRSVNGKTGS